MVLASLKNNAFKRLIFLIILQALIVSAGFVFTIIATRSLGLSVYGEIVYVIAIGTILASIIRYGSDETLIVSINEKIEKKLEVHASILLRVCCLIVLSILVLILCVAGVFSYSESLGIIAFMIVGLQLAAPYDYNNDQHKHAISVVSAKLVLIMVFYVLISFASIEALFMYATSILIANVTLLTAQYRYYFKSFEKDHRAHPLSIVVSRSIRMFNDNHFVMFASVLSLGIYSANQIYIQNTLSYLDLAIFGIPWQACSIFFIYMKQVNRIYKPILIKLRLTQSNLYLSTVFYYALVVVLPPTITSFLISLNYESVFPAIFGEDMSGYQDIFILLTIFVFFRGIQLVITQLCFTMSTNNVSFYATSVLLADIAILHARLFRSL